MTICKYVGLNLSSLFPNLSIIYGHLNGYYKECHSPFNEKTHDERSYILQYKCQLHRVDCRKKNESSMREAGCRGIVDCLHGNWGWWPATQGGGDWDWWRLGGGTGKASSAVGSGHR
jgi:hypothetical protein